MSDTEGLWDIVVTSLQDICNSNEAILFDNSYKKILLEGIKDADVNKLRKQILEHKSNVVKSKRLVNTAQKTLQQLRNKLLSASSATANTSGKSVDKIPKSPLPAKRGSGKSNVIGKSSSPKDTKTKLNKKSGRLYYLSQFNPSEPIYVGSEVAYKLRNRHTEEWIQCEVMRVIGDGVKFEIRDPEPDENNNINPTFKANYKEVLLIPPMEEVSDLVNYTYGSKVLARYPETTTFYTAVVVGNKKDGKVRLKFDGEDEVNKETEVERRLVLPFPEK